MIQPYRITEQRENLTMIRNTAPCENCGSEVDCDYLMGVISRDKLTMFSDEGYFCDKCGLKSESGLMGIPPQKISRLFQMVEGVWFLNIFLPETNSRNQFVRLAELEFENKIVPFEVFQATDKQFVSNGARLEMTYLRRLLQLHIIQSVLLTKADWLIDQRRILNTTQNE